MEKFCRTSVASYGLSGLTGSRVTVNSKLLLALSKIENSSSIVA